MKITTPGTTTYRCDICREECQPVRQFEVPMRYFMDLVTTVTVTVVADVPYGTSRGDVCPACARQAFESWIAGNKEAK